MHPKQWRYAGLDIAIQHVMRSTAGSPCVGITLGISQEGLARLAASVGGGERGRQKQGG